MHNGTAHQQKQPPLQLNGHTIPKKRQYDHQANNEKPNVDGPFVERHEMFSVTLAASRDQGRCGKSCRLLCVYLLNAARAQKVPSRICAQLQAVVAVLEGVPTDRRRAIGGGPDLAAIVMFRQGH